MKIKLKNGHKIEILTLQEKKERIEFEKFMNEAYYSQNMWGFNP